MPKKTNPHTQNDRMMVIRSDGDVNVVEGKGMVRIMGMLCPLGWGERYPWGEGPPTAIYFPTRQGYPPVQNGAAYIYVDDPMPPDWNEDYVHNDLAEHIDLALSGEASKPEAHPKAKRNRLIMASGFAFLVFTMVMVFMQQSCASRVVVS